MNQHLSAVRLFHGNVGKLQLKQMDPPYSPNTLARSKVMPGTRCSQGYVGVELSLQMGFQGACLLLGKLDHPLEGPQRAARDLAADVDSLVEGLTLHGDLVWEAGKGVSRPGRSGHGGWRSHFHLSCSTLLGISFPGRKVPCLPLASL